MVFSVVIMINNSKIPLKNAIFFYIYFFIFLIKIFFSVINFFKFLFCVLYLCTASLYFMSLTSYFVLYQHAPKVFNLKYRRWK